MLTIFFLTFSRVVNTINGIKLQLQNRQKHKLIYKFRKRFSGGG